MSTEPVYMIVARKLIGEIATGKYPVGDLLPTERELCESHQISRHTARESLRQLEQQGLINRRQGSGSKVVSTSPPVRYQQSIQNIDDLLEQGNQSRLEILSTRRLDEVAGFEGMSCVQISAIRFARHDIRPLALVDVQLLVQSGAQQALLLDKDHAARGIVDALQADRIGRIEQSLRAVNLTHEQAKTLDLEAGAAALSTARHYFNTAGDGQLMVVANSLYRGDSYAYLSTLRRG